MDFLFFSFGFGFLAGGLAHVWDWATRPGEIGQGVRTWVALALAPPELKKPHEGDYEALEAYWWAVVDARPIIKPLYCRYCMAFWLGVLAGVYVWVDQGSFLAASLTVNFSILTVNWIER